MATRGGAALSVRVITGKPIKFIKLRENHALKLLPSWKPERIANLGDVVSPVEEVTAVDYRALLSQQDGIRAKLTPKPYIIITYHHVISNGPNYGSNVGTITYLTRSINQDGSDVQPVHDSAGQSMTPREKIPCHPSAVYSSLPAS
jgi:hypothetical protein